VTDPVYYEELVSEEELLIEEYAAGRLSTPDAEAFEAVCRMRPDVRERLACERALPGILASNVPYRTARPRGRIVVMERWRLFTALAASIAAILGGASLYLNYQLSEHRSIAVNREREWQQRDLKQRETIAQLQQQLQTPPQTQPPPKSPPESIPGNSQQTGPLLASLIIPPFSRGDAAIPHFTIPDGVGQVGLHFNIGTDTDFPSYRVVVERRGSVVMRATVKPHIVNRYRTVSVVLPVKFKGEQPLQASVFGMRPAQPDEPVEGYSFILAREVLR
jgi:hypothetical protein